MRSTRKPGERAAIARLNEQALDAILYKREQNLQRRGEYGLGHVHKMPAHPKRRARVRNTDGKDGDVAFAFPEFRTAQHRASAVVSIMPDGTRRDFTVSRTRTISKAVLQQRENERIDRLNRRADMLHDIARANNIAGVIGNVE